MKKISKENSLMQKGIHWLLSSDKPEKSIKFFDKVIELNPNHDMAHYSKGMAFKFSGKLKEALIHLNKALEINPKLGRAWSNKGGILDNGDSVVSKDKLSELKKETHLLPFLDWNE